jgi:hypothetical protein
MVLTLYAIYLVRTFAHTMLTQHSISTLLPYGILVNTVTARVDPHLRVLTVTATVDVTPFDLSPDPGSKPWLLAQALNDGTDRSSSTSSSTDKKVLLDISTHTLYMCYERLLRQCSSCLSVLHCACASTFAEVCSSMHISTICV